VPLAVAWLLHVAIERPRRPPRARAPDRDRPGLASPGGAGP